MGLFNWLYRAFEPPCPHEWEKIADLKDKEDDPTAITLVRMCKFCGEVREQTFRTPLTERCPPHKWASIKTNDVYDTSDEGKANSLPLYHRVEQ